MRLRIFHFLIFFSLNLSLGCFVLLYFQVYSSYHMHYLICYGATEFYFFIYLKRLKPHKVYLHKLLFKDKEYGTAREYRHAMEN